MSERLHNRLAVAANVVTILVAVAAGAVFFLKNTSVMRPPSIPVQSRMPFRLDPRASRTLVLLLSPDCAYCRKDVPLYRELSRRRAPGVRLVAALPTSEKESRRYLNDWGIVADEVLQRSPGDFGSPGTPAIILADRDGRVTKSWVGQVRTASVREDIRRAVESASPD